MDDLRLDRELRETAARLVAEQRDGLAAEAQAVSSEQQFSTLLDAHRALARTEEEAPADDGHGIPLTLVQVASDRRSTLRPAIFYIHGGGMTSGDRFFGLGDYLPWVVSHDAVLASVEYRLAPAFPDPAPVEDCYAAACWLFEHASELGIDPARILIVGTSAGGGLAAGVCLLLRDRGGPRPLGQMLRSPMLDDRDDTPSTLQQDRPAVWSRTANRASWTALLGSRRGGADVTQYSAPARATDLSELPPAFLDTGSEDAFRDEIVAFASEIWAAGGSAELHVWPGGFHTFDVVAPSAQLSQDSLAARDAWLRRTLDRSRP